MAPVRPFRTAVYLALGLAVLALGLAGGDLLPEIPYMTALSLLLLLGAYLLEGRWQLSLRDANLMGLGLAALLGLWAIYQVVRPPTGLADTLPWPASALPYLAPVLMILLPAKMYRPKHIGDYWAMHGLALLAMAMACALAQDGVFVGVFALFAAVFVWSLSAFHLYREAGPIAADRPMNGGRWRALRPALLWAGLTGLAAVPLFWATPRTGSNWELGLNTRGKTTGLSEGSLDLNTTGSIRVNQERAFQVYAEQLDGTPMLDLPNDLKWRVTPYQTYDRGRWNRNNPNNRTIFRTKDKAKTTGNRSRNIREQLPALGAHAVLLNYTVEQKLVRSPPLADPVAWRSGDWPPIAAHVETGEFLGWNHRADGSFEPLLNSEVVLSRYVQVWAPPARLGDGPAMRIDTTQSGQRPLEMLLNVPIGLVRLRTYTDTLVERMVAEQVLPPAVLTTRDPDLRTRAPQFHEAIARALEKHFSQSSEFTYTLDLARQDKAIDPTEDFVLNTKAGHCQRFATALALMLRTQGIPCQLVLGYRGLEGRGDGWYDIREDHAHAWVEALVPASDDGLPPLPPAVAANTAPGTLQPMRWVTLDPTPAGFGPEEGTTTGLLGQARMRWEAIFKSFLLAYNAQSREEFFDALSTWIMEENGAIYLTGVAAALVALSLWRRRTRRRRAALAHVPDLLRRMLAILSKAGLEWQPGQTAREWARSASATLRQSAPTSGVASVPELIVAAYYADRFGGYVVSLDQRAALDAELHKLAMSLA
jgi:protein-glutamine gamma-glutamyltransferase